MRVAVTGGKASTAGRGFRAWGRSPAHSGPRSRCLGLRAGRRPGQSRASPNRARSPVARSSAATAAAPAVTVS
ncbi:hypothetical protein GCM10010340_31190 [Streptomyces griseoloalbus]|nr:hypothetical protein GCM10010340_31190 [Streptomyces albaduncus]